jgi:hypothetical protein
MYSSLVCVRIVEAFDLPASDNSGLSDPYVKIQLAGQAHFAPRERTTAVSLANLNPKWNELHYFLVSGEDQFKVVVEVIDWDQYTADDTIGITFVDAKLSELDPCRPQQHRLGIGRASAEIVVELSALALDRIDGVLKSPKDVIDRVEQVRKEQLAIARVALRDPLRLVFVWIHSAYNLPVKRTDSRPYIIASFPSPNSNSSPVDVHPISRQSAALHGPNPVWKRGWFFLVRGEGSRYAKERCGVGRD